jgi:hypothetical protein
MRNRILSIFFLLSLPNISFSQQCGDILLFSNIKENEAFEQKIQAYLQSHQATQREEITIPVVFHVLWHDIVENVSDERILSQLEVLNKDYNAQNEDNKNVPAEFKSLIGNTGIHFCLAVRDSQGTSITGILRKQTDKETLGISEDLFFSASGGSDAWDTEKYLNIWVANTGKAISGYGTYPKQTAAEKTGVVIHPKYFGINGHSKYGLGRVATHEIGHYLGLKHPWGNQEGECDEDDNVADTPPQKKAYFGCPNYPKKGCSESEMFMTFMDYVDDPCMFMFSEGQKQRMLATLQTERKELRADNSLCAKASEKLSSFSIYPNPTFENVAIRFDNTVQKLCNIFIINELGQILKSEKAFINSTYFIEISDFPKGIYCIKIENQVQKMVKL